MTQKVDKPEFPIIKMTASHDIHSFNSGSIELNRFLKKYALLNQQSENSQTYVACHGKLVAAYYTLTVGSVLHANAPTRIKKHQPKYPIPVMILARLAVDLKFQGMGLGKALLKNALQRTAQAADIAGIRALLVHAKDDNAIRFYQYFNFDQSPINPKQLFLVMKDIKHIVG